MFSGLLEVRPFGRGHFRRFMLFGEPKFLFGKNVPQNLYTWSFDAIGVEHSWGAAIYLGKGFEMRVTQHFLFDRFGARVRVPRARRSGHQRPLGPLQRHRRPQNLRHQKMVTALAAARRSSFSLMLRYFSES